MDSFKKFISNRFFRKDLEKVISEMTSESLSHEAEEEMKHHWWQTKNDAKIEESVNFENLLHKIHHQINLQEDRKIIRRDHVWIRIGKVAAILSIPLLTATTFLALRQFSRMASEQTFVVASEKGHRSMVKLSDGTQVWLNSGSKLVYSSSYGDQNREVELSGEGYFKVVKNKKLPFTVIAKENKVTALGTAFNIDASSASSMQMSITLEEGSVQVDHALQTSILKPGQQFSVDPSGQVEIKNIDTELYTSWHQGILIFKNEVLEDITRQLEKRYDVSFIYKNKELQQFRYRGKLRLDDSVFKTLELLRISTGMKYKIEGRTIVLDK